MISAMLTLGGISALGIAILLWADRRYPEDRDSLPAIIDQLDTTTVLFAGQHGEIDSWGNILISEDAS